MPIDLLSTLTPWDQASAAAIAAVRSARRRAHLRRFGCFVVACALALGPLPSRANLVFDGNFEHANVLQGGGLSSATTDLGDGWIVSGPAVGYFFQIFPIPGNSPANSFWIDDNFTTNVLSQHLKTTPGGHYLLSLLIASDNPNLIFVDFGSQAFSFKAPFKIRGQVFGIPDARFASYPPSIDNFVDLSFAVTATTDDTLLSFTSTYHASANPISRSGAFLSDIRVDAVTEPTSGALTAIGLLATVLAMGRRRRAIRPYQDS